MVTIGIDLVDNTRFSHWHTYSHRRLKKLFSDEEIAYCLREPALSAQRFAVRYAIKEAFFKALSQYDETVCTSFFVVCRTVFVHHTRHGIQLQGTTEFLPKCHVSVSLSHITSVSCAVVVISTVDK